MASSSHDTRSFVGLVGLGAVGALLTATGCSDPAMQQPGGVVSTGGQGLPSSAGTGAGTATGASGTAPTLGSDGSAGASAGGGSVSASGASGGGAASTSAGMGGMSTSSTPTTAGSSAGGVGATAGTGGASAGGGGMPSTAGAGTAGTTSGGGMGGSAGQGSTGGQECPADAAFCSGFEENELPDGAVFKLNGDPATPWTALFEVDMQVQRSGTSSLRVRKNSEPGASTQYKMLAVPTGGAAFWVRMYLRSDMELGGEGHNAYAAASVNDEPNDGSRIEFADDVGLSFNASDDVRWPEGYGRLTSGGTNPYTLPADTWHCIELFFDGPGQSQQLYVEGELLLSTSGYPSSAMSFGIFKFGYWGFHNEADRGVWYDDVAVGPTRVGCLAPQ